MNKEFLEEYPLFKKYKHKVKECLHLIPVVPINMSCNVCCDSQTFNMINKYDKSVFSDTMSGDQKVILIYQCQSCRKFERLFIVYISPDLDYVYKFGQYPAWEIKLDNDLEKLLGKHAHIYRKGLICESQGYGIGAFAYYRRITEEIIDDLLDSIYDLIEEGQKGEYKTALEKTKNTRVTQEKINIVKDLLPSILRPDGMNPLGVLHSELSKGLHAETDEACLEIAGHIRSILIFLINQIIQSKESAKVFTESMRSLLSKKS